MELQDGDSICATRKFGVGALRLEWLEMRNFLRGQCVVVIGMLVQCNQVFSPI